MRIRIFLKLIFAILAGPALAQTSLTPQEARTIAKEAYVYGFPLVDNYRINYAYFVDQKDPEFKAPWNRIKNTPRVFTPQDTAIQTPNSDTPYSFAGLDLRAEPVVLTVPKVPKNRYFSVQLIDQYTFNFSYIGSRSTGNGGGSFLIAGPHWKGTVPKGISKVIRAETELPWAFYRTQLFSPDDIKNVEAVQAGYKVQTLSDYLGQQPKSAPPIAFIPPLSRDAEVNDPQFFGIMAFVLQFCPVNTSEVALRQRFAKIGIVPGQPFNFAAMSPDLQKAIKEGMADAWNEFKTFKTTELDTLKLTSGDLFGTRAFLKNNYLYRMAGAILGIYGNSKQEAMYPAYYADASGQKLDGSQKAYRLRFAPGQLPPVNAFWSLTMYDLPASLLYANAINRYLINSPMLPNLKRDKDGGITLYIQNQSPGPALESNWLPAPKGPFWMAMRLYWPKPAALNGTWKQPKLDEISTSTKAK